MFVLSKASEKDALAKTLENAAVLAKASEKAELEVKESEKDE